MKVYVGIIDRDAEHRVVVRDESGEHLLPLHNKDGVNHSPDGFCWGYGGSGPAQLAYAMLVDCIGSARDAARMHQRFKERVIARMSMDQGFEIPESAVREQVLLIRREMENWPEGMRGE